MADFEYFRAEESDQFSFFRIPKALFTEKEFQSLSTDAKLLYGILLDRISLSKKNGWIDSDGYVYIIYTIAELQDLLRMSHTTVTKLLYEPCFRCKMFSCFVICRKHDCILSYRC